ncbi:RNA polymerase sigma factor [Larkinella insperata]|uniref:RNA polymerase sigma factor n=1 Tax=Larkinella insperata TaxID=332158 RepID=A0ABW3QJI0_9BACT|nr:sigma-70 family RNA polymerase sigma factor [Larkinella insperata]
MKAFYERFYGYALSVCLAYADNREDACEMLNDGFLKAFRSLKDLKNPEAVLPWLRRILVNTAIDYYRKQPKKAVEIPAETVGNQLAEPYLNDEAILAQLSAEHILTALHRLPLPYRLVFSLYVLEGYSHREIAERLHLAESTSRAHLTEANRLLRLALNAQTTDRHARTKR